MKEVTIKLKKLIKYQKTLGMNRNLINNAIIGASVGYKKTLELSGVGFRAALKGSQLNLQLGFSHDINFDIPEGIKLTVDKQTIITIFGADKQKVGMVAAKIKSLRPPEPYKGKGIKEQGQYILRKEGKKKIMKISTQVRKKFRIRNKLKKVSSKDRFRLSISRSTRNISAQIIDDNEKVTLVSASSIEKEIKSLKQKNQIYHYQLLNY